LTEESNSDIISPDTIIMSAGLNYGIV